MLNSPPHKRQMSGDTFSLQSLTIPLALVGQDGGVVASTQCARDLLEQLGLPNDRLPPVLWAKLYSTPLNDAIEWAVGSHRLGCSRYDSVGGYYPVLLRNISDKHRSQMAIVQRHRLEAIGRLAASIAHDLRAPLSTIVLNVGALTGQLRDKNEYAQQLLSELHDAAARLRTTIAHLLDAAKAGPRVRERVLLRAICERVAGYVRAATRQHGHTLTIHAAGDTYIETNPIAFEHIVSSMVTNAIESSNEPIEILLEAGVSTASELGLPAQGSLAAQGSPPTLGSVAQNEDRVAFIRVKDSGPGIPESIRTAIFDPTFTTKPDGCGLGLALARDFAQEHGGDLILERTTTGASFVVGFPIHEAQH